MAVWARNGKILQEGSGTLEVGIEWERRARGNRVGARDPSREGKGTKGDQRSQRALKNKRAGLNLKFDRDEKPLHRFGEAWP